MFIIYIHTMNNKKTQKKTIHFMSDIDDEIVIETIWEQEFAILMNDMKNIKMQINTIRDKVEELKKDRLFMKNNIFYRLR